MEQSSAGGPQGSCMSIAGALLGWSLSATLVASSLWGDESVCSDGVGGCERLGKQVQLWSCTWRPGVKPWEHCQSYCSALRGDG